MSALLALFGFLVFAIRRLLTYLHLFQQEEYDGRRFLAWLIENRAWDRRLSLALAAIVAAEFILPGAPPGIFAALTGAACLGIAALERDPRKSAKKPLVMTARAKRIYAIALALISAIGVVAALASDLALVWIVAVQLVPIGLVAANLLLAPFEARVQARYWREARLRSSRHCSGPTAPRALASRASTRRSSNVGSTLLSSPRSTASPPERSMASCQLPMGTMHRSTRRSGNSATWPTSSNKRAGSI